MQLTESSIYIGLKRLREHLYRCQFLMSKTDRIVYGTPLMQSSAETLKLFTMAFMSNSGRVDRLTECIGAFSVLRTDLIFCFEQNLIKFPNPKFKDGEEDYSKFVNSNKIDMFELVANIDNDMCRWLASLQKAKTIVD